MLLDIYEPLKYDVCKFLTTKDIVRLARTCRMMYVMYKEIDMDFITKNMVSMKKAKEQKMELLRESLKREVSNLSDLDIWDYDLKQSLKDLITTLEKRMISKEEYFKNSTEKYLFQKQLILFRRYRPNGAAEVELHRKMAIMMKDLENGKFFWKQDYLTICHQVKNTLNETPHRLWHKRLLQWNDVWN